jgi:hypothetical protein
MIRLYMRNQAFVRKKEALFDKIKKKEWIMEKYFYLKNFFS